MLNVCLNFKKIDLKTERKSRFIEQVNENEN